MYPAIERFQAWRQCQATQASTHRHYASDVRLFFAWLERPPEAASPTDIINYIIHCQQQNQAATTIRRRLAALRAFYRFLATDTPVHSANPIPPRWNGPRPARRLPRDLPDADLVRLLAVLASPLERAACLLMLDCGLRVGEVQRLSLGDLALDAQPPRLRVHGKGSIQRTVYLADEPLAALRAWLEVRLSTAELALFTNRAGQRLSVAAIQRRLTQAGRRAGIRLTCHQFRHTFGRRLAEAGLPPTTIQALLGHTRLHTTQVYVNLANTQVCQEYAAALPVVQSHLSEAFR